MYTKEQLLIDLDTMHVTFRALIYASRLAFDSPIDIGIIDVQNLSVGNNGNNQRARILATVHQFVG